MSAPHRQPPPTRSPHAPPHLPRHPAGRRPCRAILRHRARGQSQPRPPRRADGRPGGRGHLRRPLLRLGDPWRGGDRPSAGQSHGDRDPQGRRLGGGRGDRGQCGAGLWRADRLRDRRRLFRAAVGPEDPEGGGPERLGPQPQGAQPGDRTSARHAEGLYPLLRRDLRQRTRRGGRLGHAACPLRQAALEGLVPAGDPRLRGGLSGHPEHRILRRLFAADLQPPGRRRGRCWQLQQALGADGQDAARGRAVPQPGARPHLSPDRLA